MTRLHNNTRIRLHRARSDCDTDGTTRLTLALVLLVGIGACAPRERRNGLSDVGCQQGREPAPELRDLATKVAEAYRKAKYVSFDQEVIAPPYRIECTSRMAEGKLDTRLAIDGKLVAVVTLSDGRMEETRLDWVDRLNRTLHNVALSYDAPTPNGTDDLVLRNGLENYLCLVGSNFMSWVGKDSERALFLRDRILHGRLLPSEDVNGHPCQVVMWEDKVPGYHRRDRVYFDSQTYFWIKWETLTSDGTTEPVLERTRVHRQITVLDEDPADAVWRFSAKARSVSSETNTPEGGDSMSK